MKRYAIVRVDDATEGIKWLDILDEIVRKRKVIIDYGDTKEQLVKKVETAYRLAIADVSEDGIVSYEEVAKFIVEFLGVEE